MIMPNPDDRQYVTDIQQQANNPQSAALLLEQQEIKAQFTGGDFTSNKHKKIN
jgi:hypothetical protein